MYSAGTNFPLTIDDVQFELFRQLLQNECPYLYFQRFIRWSLLAWCWLSLYQAQQNEKQFLEVFIVRRKGKRVIRFRNGITDILLCYLRNKFFFHSRFIYLQATLLICVSVFIFSFVMNKRTNISACCICSRTLHLPLTCLSF